MKPRPQTHEAVLRVSNILKERTQATKAEITECLQDDHGGSSSTTQNVINLAVQAMVMVDAGAKDWHSTDFVLGGYRPTSWLPNESFQAFVERSFPLGLESSSGSVRQAIEQRASMKAWKLQKRLGVRFRRTNNLAEHLLFDPRRNCLYLFHHVAFLKANLERFQHETKPLSIGLKESLKRGALPPQLLVETVHSLQGILFPSVDPSSAAILDELIAKRGFDPHCALYEGYKLFLEPPEDFEYVFWGERLAHLHHMLTSRPPRNMLERWFQRQSSEGNALFVALLALLIGILVGIVSIILACVQVWIAWMAWKHPAAPPGST
ncbi:hypothetical protein ACCO45_005516 [Purpureocillium lilacinum]